MDPKFTPGFLTIKLIDIGYVTSLYFVFGLLAAKAFDYYYDKFDPEDYKTLPFWKLLGSILLHTFALGVTAYILRNFIEMIPFPLDGVAGFRHHRLKELEGGVMLSVILVLFQNNLTDKINYFAKKYFGITTRSGEHVDELIEIRLAAAKSR